MTTHEIALTLGKSRLQALVELTWSGRTLVDAVVLDMLTRDGESILGGVESSWMDFADRVIYRLLKSQEVTLYPRMLRATLE